MATETRRQSSREVSAEELQTDLLTFRKMALQLGATEAEIVRVSIVDVQERIWMKCLVPRCSAAGQSPYCPPNSPRPDFVRKLLSQYQWAIVFRRDVQPFAEYVAKSEASLKEAVTPLQKRDPFHRKTWEIVGRLESYVQSRGYDLAMGLSAGSCNINLCGSVPCAVLRNEPCRHPSRARPSLEGLGIDVFGLARKVGWSVYMIRRIEPNPAEIPSAVSIAMVLVY